MKRAFVVAASLMVCWLAAAVNARDDKPSEIKEIMVKINKPSTGLLSNIGAELRSDSPDWKEIQPQAKEVAKLTAMLGKDKPPKGDAASWTKLTKDFAANAAALDKAIAAKDQAAAKAAYAKMSGKTCDTCHEAHRQE
jgi:cytochrome c556